MNLIVISDIFPAPHLSIIFPKRLPTNLDTTRFALNDLRRRPDLSGQQLHQYLFDHGGIDEVTCAIRNLVGENRCFGLGYSAGGTALWRAVAKGVPLVGVYCISSTRLRKEAEIPIPNHVVFGAQDPKKPSEK